MLVTYNVRCDVTMVPLTLDKHIYQQNSYQYQLDCDAFSQRFAKAPKEARANDVDG